MIYHLNLSSVLLSFSLQVISNYIDHIGIGQVRTQHANRCVDFLSRELRVCTPKEAEERIFFISAKEALLTRMREREKPVSCELS